jgi:hypothetical protein
MNSLSFNSVNTNIPRNPHVYATFSHTFGCFIGVALYQYSATLFSYCLAPFMNYSNYISNGSALLDINATWPCVLVQLVATTTLLAFEFLPSISRLRDQSLLYRQIALGGKEQRRVLGDLKSKGLELRLTLYASIVRPITRDQIAQTFIAKDDRPNSLYDAGDNVTKALEKYNQAKYFDSMSKIARAMVSYEASQRDYRKEINNYARNAVNSANEWIKSPHYTAFDKKRSHLLLTKLRYVLQYDSLKKRSISYKKPKVIKFAKQVSDFDFSRQSARYVNHTIKEFMKSITPPEPAPQPVDNWKKHLGKRLGRWF